MIPTIGPYRVTNILILGYTLSPQQLDSFFWMLGFGSNLGLEACRGHLHQVHYGPNLCELLSILGFLRDHEGTMRGGHMRPSCS